MATLLEALSREEKEAYQQRLLQALDRVDSLDGEALKRAAKLTALVQRNILGRLAQEEDRATYTLDGKPRWNPVWLPRLQQAVTEVAKEMAERYGKELGEFLPTAWDEGNSMLDEAVKPLGFRFTAPRITPQQVGIATQWSPDLVQGMSDNIRSIVGDRIRVAVLTGESPEKLIKDLRKPVMSQKGVLGSVQYRAERIARTEINRLHSLGNQQRMQQFTQHYPRYRMQKAMLVSEVNGWPCKKCVEVANEGPWDVDDPNAPDLPVHPQCRCRMIPVFADIPAPHDAPSDATRDASISDSTNDEKSEVDEDAAEPALVGVGGASIAYAIPRPKKP